MGGMLVVTWGFFLCCSGCFSCVRSFCSGFWSLVQNHLFTVDLVLMWEWVLLSQMHTEMYYNSHLSLFLFEEWHIWKVDVQDNMSNVSEERSSRQQDIKKGLQFIEYDFVVFILACSFTCLYIFLLDGWLWERPFVFFLRIFASTNVLNREQL